MNNITTTLMQQPKRPVSTGAYACLVHIYPNGPALGQQFSLGKTPLIIGRSDDCDIPIRDHSISRRHVRIEPTPDGVLVSDLVSTNGTFINDHPIKGTEIINDGDYLRVGNNIYRFLAGGNVESQYHDEIYRLTIVDGLTQTYNRRYLFDFLDRELFRSARHKRPLAFLLLDIDRFKTVNDQIGHLAGNFALRELAAIVSGMVRREDLFARYGGEEFGVALIETSPALARVFAERLREIIENHTFQFEEHVFRLTVSIGVVSTSGDITMTTKDLVNIADRRLSEAKFTGRNRVVGLDAETVSHDKKNSNHSLMHEFCGDGFNLLKAV
jgi:two-component system cell cycle response regulator